MISGFVARSLRQKLVATARSQQLLLQQRRFVNNLTSRNAVVTTVQAPTTHESAGGVHHHDNNEGSVFDDGAVNVGVVASGGDWLEIAQPDALHDDLPNFERVEHAFSSRSTLELIRTFAVLHACSFTWLVDHADSLLKLSRMILGQRLTNWLVKKTFFAQFCAAETDEGLRPVMQSLESSGVSGILDYAAEADLGEETTSSSSDPVVRSDKPIRCVSFGDEEVPFADEGVVARTYPYEGELACDAATKVFVKCIETAAAVAEHKETGSHPFAAIKVTALGNPLLLKRMSEMIVEVKRLFERMEAGLGRPAVESLSLSEWHTAYTKYFTVAEDEPGLVDRMFWDAVHSSPEEWAQERPCQEPRMDVVDWSRSMNIKVAEQLVRSCKKTGPLKSVVLSEEELELSQALFKRLDKLAALASGKKVSLMIDAEQTYFQPCIDANVLRLQRLYNKNPDGSANDVTRKTATIFGTYQCYLTNTDQRIKNDLERSKREGWRFAAKLVRGAYMASERKLAEDLGLPSVIWDTVEETHDCYDRNSEMLIRDPNAEVMIASHNQASCEKVTRLMKLHNVDRATGNVHFGQLLGMSDHITLTLGVMGYSAFKYLPYGNVEEVMPYLIRRAQENNGLMAGAGHERAIIFSEIKRRLFSSDKKNEEQ